MNAAYISTVGDVRYRISNGETQGICNDIKIGYQQNLLSTPSHDEERSWFNSIPPLIKCLPESCDTLPILFEMKMPIGKERADVILLGGENRALVIELKHWGNSKISLFNGITNQVVLGEIQSGAMRSHPGYQVDGYVGKISNFHSVGSNYEIRGLSFLDSTQYSLEYDQILNQNYKSPTFFSDQTENLGGYVTEYLLPNHQTLESAEEFIKGEFEISGRLVDYISNNSQQIKDKIYNVLTTTGFSLSEEQLNTVNQVLFYAKKARQQKNAGIVPVPKTFLIKGDPGSGKTLVALSILIEAIGEGLDAIYGLRRNGALVTTLRSSFTGDEDLNHLIYYINNPRGNNGIADRNWQRNNLDLIICDEAQRMLNQSFDILPTRGSVIAYFSDESQRLNWDEQGIEENIQHGAKKANAVYTKLKKLPSGVRCRGGELYHEFIEELLNNPPGLIINNSKVKYWRKSYKFKVFSDINSFLAALRDERDNQQNRVALTASWTESKGKSSWRLNNRGGKPELSNIRVANELESGNCLYPSDTQQINWVMNPKDYRDFWAGVSNDLDVCASIYGSQGFESDVVGFIWGRDLVWDPTLNNWRLGGPNTSMDTSGGTIRSKCIKNMLDQIAFDTNHENYMQVKELLLNRIRIFLTRGILGTYVYAEDEETRKFLLNLR